MKSKTLTFNTSAYARAKGVCDFNKLRDMLTESHFQVDGERESDGTVKMIVKNINESTFVQMANRCRIYEAADYLVDDDYVDDTEDLYGGEPAEDDLEALMDLEAPEDFDADEDTLTEPTAADEFAAEDWDDAVEENYFDEDFDEFAEDDFGNEEYDATLGEFPEDMECPDGECDTYDIFDIDECISEALKTNSHKKAKPMFEGRKPVVLKRKGCCPPKRQEMLRPLTEAFKAFEDKDQKKLDKAVASIEDIVRSVKNQSIGAVEVRDAFKKLKAQQNAIKKIAKTKTENYNVTDVPGVAAAIKKMIKADPEKAKEIEKFREDLVESVVNAIAGKKKSLHENVNINGKGVGKISTKQLAKMLKEATVAKAKYSNMLTESVGNAVEHARVKKNITNKNKLITVLMEEIAYRQLAAKFNKALFEAEDEEKKDDEKKTSDATEMSPEELAAMMGAGDNFEDTSADDTDAKDGEDEEGEEVELARIIIELKDKEAADELKDLCVEAGIPEDAIEIEETSDEDSEEKTDEEGSEEDAEEDKDGEANESIHYANIRKLFEAEGDEDAAEGEDAPADDAEAAEETEDGDAEEETSDATVKFILTNTDYAQELADVLADEYGIEADEFNEMIGGQIVTEDGEDEEDSDDEDAFDDEADDKSDDDDGKKDEEEISADDIFGNM